MRQTTPLHLSPHWMAASLDFRCPHPECSFRRTFGTDKGLRNGLVAHMLQAHDIQILFDVAETSLSEYRDRTRRARGAA